MRGKLDATVQLSCFPASPSRGQSNATDATAVGSTAQAKASAADAYLAYAKSHKPSDRRMVSGNAASNDRSSETGLPRALPEELLGGALLDERWRRLRQDLRGALPKEEWLHRWEQLLHFLVEG